MGEKLEISTIEEAKELLQLYINQMKEFELDKNSSYTMADFSADNFFDPVEFAPKKDIVSRFKLLTARKKYSKVSFKEFYLNNK